MSVCPQKINYFCPFNVGYEDTEGIASNQNGKITLYFEGGSVCKRAKLTSVQRWIVLCMVKKHMRILNYFLTSLIFTLLPLNLCDLKILLIVNGHQTASALIVPMSVLFYFIM